MRVKTKRCVVEVFKRTPRIFFLKCLTSICWSDTPEHDRHDRSVCPLGAGAAVQDTDTSTPVLGPTPRRPALYTMPVRASLRALLDDGRLLGRAILRVVRLRGGAGLGGRGRGAELRHLDVAQDEVEEREVVAQVRGVARLGGAWGARVACARLVAPACVCMRCVRRLRRVRE